MKPTLLWDMDGTINRCAEYYKKCVEDFVAFKHNRTAIEKEIIHEIVNKIDLASTKLPMAFSRTRFPKSFEAASLVVDILADKEPNLDEARMGFDIGDLVFSAEYKLFDGAFETLKQYADSGWQMVLVTKGDPGVQADKIKKNGIRDFFHGIHIVFEKNESIYAEILGSQEIDPTSSWMIGDSLKDDIAPTKALGLKTVHVNGGHFWEYDHDQAVPDHTVTSIKDITDIIPLYQRV